MAETGIEVLSHMHCQALNVGIEELRYGSAFLSNAANKYNLPLVSSNLRDHNGETPSWLHRSLLVPSGDKNIAILGIINSLPNAAAELKNEQLTRKDPAEALHEVLAEVKNKKVDFVILLSRLSAAQTKALVEQFPAINLAITKHSVGKALLSTTTGQVIAQGGRYCSDFRSILLTPQKDGQYLIQPQEKQSLGNEIHHDRNLDTIIMQALKNNRKKEQLKTVTQMREELKATRIPQEALNNPEAMIEFLEKRPKN